MEQVRTKDSKIRLRGVIKHVYKKMGKAIVDYQMLEQHDNILVVMSPEEKSLSLIHLFKMRQKRVPIRFNFIACLLDECAGEKRQDEIIDYFQRERIEYMVVSIAPPDTHTHTPWCSFEVRKMLCDTARQQGCNKIALPDVLDDVTESVVLNLCFLGKIGGIKPKIELLDTELYVIRPLCYVERGEVTNFFSQFRFPRVAEPREAPGDERKEIARQIVESLKKGCPYVNKNIFNSLNKIRRDYLL